jgi:RNA polymerase sigma-70 factor (ECF subfamily)
VGRNPRASRAETSGPRSARPAEPSADRDAIARVAAGDLAALGELYDRHVEAVHRFVARATCGSADAPDIAQDVFLSLSSSAASYDGRLDCRPWLFGIAAFHVLNRRRAATRLRRFLERLLLVQDGRTVDQVRALETRETMGATARALEKIAPAKRVALLLAEVEGLSGDEIAVALGIPAGTVWRRIHEARTELRAVLAGDAR